MKKLLLIIIVSLLAAIDKAVACQYTSVNAIAEDAKDSLWPTINNFLPYIILAIILVSAILYILFLRKQREIYKEKIRFFANTAHDMRTPLTLIKAPLDEITERDTISDVERNNLNLALKNVDILLQLTTTLINFEKTDCYSGNLSVTEYELNALRLTPCFDGIFISSEHGCKKPDRYFFEKMIRTYDIDRSSAIMIGNDGVCDIRGAIQARLATLYVRTDISPKEVLPPADHVLEHMDMKRIADILLAED